MLAIGEVLKRNGFELVFTGRRFSMEEEMIRTYFPESLFKPLPAFRGPPRQARTGVLRFAFCVLRATFMLLPVFIFKQVSAVIASGGFASLPPIVLSILFHKPLFLLEQNRIPGRVIKYFSHYATLKFSGFPIRNFIFTGNPLRPGIVQSAKCTRHAVGTFVLVLGGSQGAEILIQRVLEIAPDFPNIKFIILLGKRPIPERIKIPDNCELVGFTLTPEKFYSQASLALSRAGGMILAELLAFGIPSILIPYPYATDAHQKANAQYLEKEGVSIVLDQNHLHELGQILKELLEDKTKLRRMRKNAQKLARLDASEVIGKRIEKCLVRRNLSTV